MSLVAVLLVAAVGGLIGTTGLGGFLLVPLLLYVEDLVAGQAVAVAAIAFLASGLVSLAPSRRNREFEWREFGHFLASAAPGAMLGAGVVAAVGDRVLEVVIAIAFASAGVAEWFGVPRERSRTGKPGVGAGLATGFGSALTGTSGPMIALPLLAWSGLSIARRIMVAQIAQVPIALGATVAFLSFGEVPWRVALWCSVALCSGVILATLAGPRFGSRGLRRMAAVLMLAAAAGVLAKLHGNAP